MNKPTLQEFLAWCALSLALQWVVHAQTMQCLQNTNLPTNIACNQDEWWATHIKEILGSTWLAVWLILLWKHRRNKKRKIENNQENQEEEIGKDVVIDVHEIKENQSDFVPGSSIAWERVDKICDIIVEEVVGESNLMGGIKSNESIQKSAVIWIQQEDTKNMLSQLAQAKTEYIGIHNLMVLSKNQRHQWIIWILLYYFLYHEPLVSEYEDFFSEIILRMDEALDEGKWNIILGLRTEYDTYSREFNLSPEHLQSIRERWLSVMKATQQQ